MKTLRQYPFFDLAQAVKLSGSSLISRYPATGLSSGIHASRQRGWSTEFAEHRPYVSGDDLRHLDWKVFGRSDKRYVRQHEDDRTRTCYLVLDHSGSMAYRGEGAAMSKFQCGQACVSYLAWLALRQADPTTIVPVAEFVGSFPPATAHPAQLYRLLDQLAGIQPRGATSLSHAFQILAQRLRPAGLVIVVSDLLTDLESLTRGLARLRGAGHDVWLLQVLDRAEWVFPFPIHRIFQGLEGEESIEVDGAGMRQLYLARIQRFGARLATLTARRNMRYLRTFTDQQPVDIVYQLTCLGSPR